VKILSVVYRLGVNPLCSTLRCAWSWSRTLFSRLSDLQSANYIVWYFVWNSPIFTYTVIFATEARVCVCVVWESL